MEYKPFNIGRYLCEGNHGLREDNHQTSNLERLEGIPDEIIMDTVKMLSKMTPCSSRDNTLVKLQKVLHERREEEKKKHGVHIVMSCGEEYHIDTDQPQVKEIYVQGEKITPFNWEPKSTKDVKRMLSSLLGGEWKFYTNQDHQGYLESLKWYKNSGVPNFSIPKNPSDIAYVPYTWARDGTPFSGSVGVYHRQGVEMVNPKNIMQSKPIIKLQTKWKNITYETEISALGPSTLAIKGSGDLYLSNLAKTKNPDKKIEVIVKEID